MIHCPQHPAQLAVMGLRRDPLAIPVNGKSPIATGPSCGQVSILFYAFQHLEKGEKGSDDVVGSGVTPSI
ncbi:hypothetical protein J6590_068772, partial [Homalodisca vitripennis]